MDQYIGKMLDNRYELLELIGSGGMAWVYKAKCHRLNRMVAVKILKSDLADSEEFRRRFHDESRAVAQLSHANIMSVYDVSRTGDVEYIVMELIEGITLKQYMERRGRMDWREALHFITQIMRGLSHAHSRGIIHRDIKPQNIMILRDGSVKVADFGIACLADTSQTLRQEALGSVHYISPEQARGDRMDQRSDIYSAGVVLYEMLTGRLPFEGDSAVSVAIQHLSSVPLAPREINAEIPEAMELICMKAMSPNLDKRYPSADAMLEDLEKFRKDPATDLAYIRTDLEEKQDTSATQPIAVAEVAAANRAVKAEKAAAEKRQQQKTYAIIGGVAAALLLLIFVIYKIAAGFGGPQEPESYEVPNLLGQTVEEAREMAEIKNIFEIEVVGSRVNPTYQPGEIVEQTPTAGTTRKENRVISVYVCVAETMKAMPQLEGTEFQKAKVQLSNMGLDLTYERKEEFSDKFPKGQVISTEPAVGEPLKKGNTVLLVVSKGPEKKPVSIPSFLEETIENAALNAEKLGLVVAEHVFKFSEKPEGIVIEQSIAVGKEVPQGSTITFTVSMGTEKKPVSVPDFKGKSLSAAKAEAEKLGLIVGEPVYETSGQAADTVLKQSISAKTEVEQGTVITFTVSDGVELVPYAFTFTIPEKYTGQVSVEFRQDAQVLTSIKMDTAVKRTDKYTFTGEKGKSSTIRIYINGTEEISEVITFG